MFKFEYIAYLHLLWFIPVIVLVYILTIRYKVKAYQRFAKTIMLDQMSPKRISRIDHIKFGFFVLAIALFSIAMANPQWGTKREKIKTKSSDVFIALDISNSMLAQDVSPNRLEKAKHFSQKLIKSLAGDRIGLIIFAGSAYLHMPLTNDYGAAAMLLKSANPQLAGTQGTAIDEAIDMAEKSILEDKTQKALIIISDGENHDQKAIDRAETARNNGLHIYTIGVGSTSGGYIPVTQQGQLTYKKDKSGEPIVSKLNPELLQSLVNSGDFYMLNNEDDIVESLQTKIEKMEKREVEQRSFTDYNSYFQHFLLSGIVFFLLSIILSKEVVKNTK